MIYLEPADLRIVLTILRPYPYTFYAFGSRVKGTHKPLSDLDLCYFEPIPLTIIEDIRERFESSDLPFTVDLVNATRCRPGFRTLIEKDMVKLESKPVA